MKLIGITGKARSGKDSLASHLCLNRGFLRIAFADPLKESAQRMFGLTAAQTWSDELKEVPIEPWGISPRRMFQLLGTECTKPFFGDDIWCKRWKMAFNHVEGEDVVVPDVRFDHEAAFLRELGAIIVQVHRGEALTGDAAAHSSEAGLSTAPDIFLNNNGTLEELYAKFDELVK